MAETLEPRVRVLEMQIARHEAVCAERYTGINNRLNWLIGVLSLLIFVLLIGEGSIADVAKRLFVR
jgi:hypothetical protein